MKLLDAVTPNDEKKNDTKLINHAATRRRLKKKGAKRKWRFDVVHLQKLA
jgi:hypothetical protein